jgi:hypothetical protein
VLREGNMKVILKSKYSQGLVKLAERRGNPIPDDKFEYFKKLIMDHLNTLDGEGDDEAIHSLKKAGFPVGTVRIHKDGIKRIKIAPGKWRPKYDSHSRGAKMAIAAIKRKVNATGTAKELMDIVMENRDRFSDAQGRPLPFVQELSKYVSSRGGTLEEKQTPKKKEKTGNKKPVDTKKVDPAAQLYKEGDKINFEMGGVKYSGIVEKVLEFRHKRGNETGYSTKVEGKSAGFMVYNKDIIASSKSDLVSNQETEPDSTKKIRDKKKGRIFYDPGKPKRGQAAAARRKPKKTDDMKSDFDNIKEKYQSAKSFEGDDDEVFAGKETVAGKWKLVEADIPTASHDETTFHKTPGFPTGKDGSTINDRDYGHDKAAQEAVISIGADFDGRALKVDNPIIVTKDGIVISGNNRTMSSKIAARKGTDAKYIEVLKKRAKKFGFTEDQVNQFKNPRVVFEVENDGEYSTDQFAKFNQSGKKEMGPTEKAVKVSKLIKPETVESIAKKIGEFDTLGELYADHGAVQYIFSTFKESGLIGENEIGKYLEGGAITEDGKAFVETALLGSVMNESNIRGFNRPGCKSIRATLVRAITPLIENKGLNGYSINRELNEAVDIAMQVAINRDKFKSVDEFSRQGSMFETLDPVSLELAKKLEGTQKAFAEFMQKMNGGLKYAASGEADIFLGGVETKDDIVSRFMGMKKSIMVAVDFFRNRVVKKSEEDTHQLSIEGIDPYSEKLDVLKYGEKAIAVDFDGVINSFKNGWKGPTETDEPVLSAAESIATLFHRGYKIIIFSTRANTEEGVKTIREYLLKHTEDPGLVEKIEITDKKPIAHVYIDDRAIPFTGDWAETLKQIDEFKPWTETEKSLTWSGYPLQGRMRIHGMDISIENKKGSTRSGTDKDGKPWSQKMGWDYGYIRGTVGKDKDYVDCFVGPNLKSEKVFIIHQVDPFTDGHPFDEDKIMLGWDNEKDAKIAYLEQYNRPDFFGSMDEMNIDEFKDKIFDEKNKGKMVKALITEDELRENVRFLQAVYDFFKDEENPGKVNIYRNHNKLGYLDGFPKGLDLENCELLGVEKDKIWFAAGGDWQQMINFAVELKNGKLAITNLFDGGDHKHDRSRVADWIKNVEMAGGIKKGGSADEN